MVLLDLSCVVAYTGVPRPARAVSDAEEEEWKAGSHTYNVPSKVSALL